MIKRLPLTETPSDNVRGMLWLTFSMGIFALSDTLTKSIAIDLPIGQVVAIRSLLAAMLVLPLIVAQHSPWVLVTSYDRAMLARNFCEVVSVMLYALALVHLPIASVTSILQTLPLAMTAIAAMFLGEQVGWRRWTAAVIGLLGVVLIVRPGTGAFSWWYVPLLISIVFIAARDVSTRFVDRSISTLVITFYALSASAAAGFLLGTYETWIIPRWENVLKIVIASVSVFAGYYALFEAWRVGEVSAIAPFRYTIVLWAIIFGWLLLGEVPDGWTLAGTSIVVGAGLYTFVRERRLARQAARDRANPGT